MDEWYMVKTTNQLFEFRQHSVHFDSQNVGKALAEACYSLKTLSKDVIFYDCVQDLVDRGWEHEPQARKLLEDVGHFTLSFLQIEKQAMKQAGLTEYAANALLREMQSLQMQLRVRRRIIDVEQLQSQVEQLRDMCCTRAEEVKSWDLQRANQQRWRQMVTRAAKAAGGIVVAYIPQLVKEAFFPGSPSITAGAFDTLSVTLGTQLFSRALKDVRRIEKSTRHGQTDANELELKMPPLHTLYADEEEDPLRSGLDPDDLRRYEEKPQGRTGGRRV